MLKDNELWAATDGGIIRWNIEKKIYQKYVSQQGLASNHTYSVASDNQGNIWVGTVRGLNKYDGTKWSSLEIPAKYPFTSVISITPDRNQNIWFSGDFRQVLRYDGTTLHSYDQNDGISVGNPAVSFLDSKGNIWAGGSIGKVNYYDGTAWHTISQTGLSVVSTIQSIAEDKNGNLWFGGNMAAAYQGTFLSQAAVTCYDGANWKTYAVNTDLFANVVTAVFCDEQGNIWAGTDVGLAKFDGTSWKNYPPKMVWLMILLPLLFPMARVICLSELIMVSAALMVKPGAPI